MPRISVIMPVYNIKEEWLRESIESILNQTFSDFEFIIIDDGSTNNTPQVLNEYYKKDSRIRIIQGEHKGISNALNKGLKAATGEYIARMDGDDISLPTRFEKQVEYLEEHQDISILGTNIIRFPNEKKISYVKNVGYLDMLADSPLAHPTVFIRKKDFEMHDLLYNEKFKTSEDYELWSKAILKHLKIANLDNYLYKYRKNPNGNSKNKLIGQYDAEIKSSLMNELTTNKKLQNKIYDIVDEFYSHESIINKLFSIKNKWRRGQKYKIVRLLGIIFYLAKNRLSKDLNKKQNCIFKIQGGLGNQMFQFAFGKANLLINKCDILYDLSFYNGSNNTPNNVTKRTFDLDCFNLSINIASEDDLQKYLKEKSLPKIIQKLLKLFRLSCITKEKEFTNFDKNLFTAKQNIYFEGFFQSEYYFKDFREELLNDFTLKIPLDNNNQEIINQIKNTNSVSLHVRKGDYTKLQDVYVQLGTEYYTEAIEYIKQHVENPTFFIFSDDINWVKQNLKIDFPCVFVDFNQGKDYFDLELMRNCKHNIIANSSFSWWGAWLNMNPDKIVIAPKQWFLIKKLKKKDINCEEWIKI